MSPHPNEELLSGVERDVFVCGPPAMTSAVLRTLRDLGVPGPQIHKRL